tara:strand:- start:836 stop:1324 length:489 start_codon:yes stop_codon:yes gene_type:complete
MAVFSLPLGNSEADAAYRRCAIKISDNTWVSDEWHVEARNEGRCVHHDLGECMLQTLWDWSEFRRNVKGQLGWCRYAIMDARAERKDVRELVIQRLGVLRAVVSDKDTLAEVIAYMKILGVEDDVLPIGPSAVGRPKTLYLEDRMINLDPGAVEQYIERMTK